jgi:hypothetical protein
VPVQVRILVFIVKKEIGRWFEGRNVSCEGEGESFAPELQNPLVCFDCCFAASGVSPRYLSVVDGSMAIVLLSLLKLFRGVLRLLSLALIGTRFIITTSSSE